MLRDTIRFTEPICLRLAHIFLFCDWRAQGKALSHTVTEGTQSLKLQKDRGESSKGSLVPLEEGKTGGAEVPRTMAEAVTYADLRFVKAPLKKNISSQLGKGKGE